MDSVFIPILIDEVTEATESPSKTYRLDLDAGRIKGYVDDLEAVNQAIRKAIITPRFKCLIYDDQYGSEIGTALTATDVTSEYIETVLPGFIEDALRPDTRILKVYDFSFEFIDEKVYIFFRVDTIYGDTTFEEVI